MRNYRSTFCALLLLAGYASKAQSPIQGETAKARVGTPYIYYWNYGSADPRPNPPGSNMGGYNWHTDNGTINSEWSTGTAVNASITFSSAGTTRVWIQWQGGEKQSVTFEVKDAGTAAPTTYVGVEKFCGYTRLWRSSEPPSGYEWWWQTSYTGESLSLGKADTLRVLSTTNPKTIFLRPRKSASPFTWGDALNVGTITVSNFNAGSPTPLANPFYLFYNVPGNISVQSLGSDVQFKWYVNDFGQPLTSTNSISKIFSKDATVFVSSFNGCESIKAPLQVKVVPLPQVTTANSNSPDVSNGRSITLKTTTNYDTYRWFSSAVVGVIATTPSITTNTPGQYYVEVSKANVSGGVTVVSPPFPVTTSSVQNYISATDVQIPGVSDPVAARDLPLDKRTENLSYFDGLGRPIQNVSRQASTSHYDIVQSTQYDEFGREALIYPSYVHGEGNGWMKVDPTGKAVGAYEGSIHNQFYQTAPAVAHDNKALSTIEFDQSPLNREVKKFGPGESWYTNNKFSQTKYLSNVDGLSANTDQEKVVAWKLGLDNTLIFENSSEFYYPTNELFIKVTIDEQNHNVREYTNKQGQLILKKVQVSNDTPSLNDLNKWACTYYVYDDLNNLVMVIPPQAVKEILSAE